MHKIFKNLLYFSSAVVWVKFVGIFTMFFLAKLLSPTNMGVFSALLVIIGYSGMAHLGAVASLVKEGAFHLGQGNTDKVREIESSVLGSVLLSILGMLALGFFVTPFLFKEQNVEYLLLVRLVFVAAAIDLLTLYHRRRFAMRQDFQYASMIDSGQAVLVLIFYAGGAWIDGLRGTVIGLLISQTIIVSWSSWLSFGSYGFPGLRFSPKLIGALIKIGFPIMIVNSLFIVMASIDRIMTIALLGAEANGYYHLGHSIVSSIVLVPYAISQVLYPRINEKFGNTMDEQTLKPLLLHPARTLSLAIPFAIAALIIACPIVFLIIFPEYAPGLLAAQIVLVGSFFMALMRNGANFLIATNRNKAILFCVGTSSIVNVIGNYTLVKMGFGIEGVAFSTMSAQMLLAAMIWHSLFSCFGEKRRGQIKGIFQLFAPMFILVPLLIGSTLLINRLEWGAITSSIVQAIVLLIVFAVIIFSFKVYRQWFSELFALLKSAMPKLGLQKTKA